LHAGRPSVVVVGVGAEPLRARPAAVLLSDQATAGH
jgi:hypothetical protein